jgi:metallo-beta-lactamase family protein
MMKIQFLGATNTVTGSRFLLTQGKTTLLVDCGLFQGFKNLRLRNRAEFPISPKRLDAVFLTHAHLDHSGFVPLLVKEGFRGPIYATRATVDLCRILLPDSGYLQEEEARLANKQGFSKHHPALPLYTAEDAERALEQFEAVAFRHPIQIPRKGRDGFIVEAHPAGHLLGAASLHVHAGSTSIAFSGDVGRTKDPLIRNPEPRFSADSVVIESTYGNRLHPDSDAERELQETILRTHARNGTLLIPSFAVGRAQLVLYYLMRLKRKGAIPNLPVYLNSPMAAQANQAFARNTGELKLSAAEIEEIWKGVHIVGTPGESKALNARPEPAIIIAASGMATGGRVLHHLKRLAPVPKNTILFAGYQAGGTRGDLMVRGADQIKIHGEHIPVRAEVVSLENLSGHADANELLAWLGLLERKPKQVFVVHGEPEAADALRLRIVEELGIDVVVPEYEQEFELP